MRTIDVFECFIAIGRVEAGITLSRASGRSADELEKTLIAVIEDLPPFMGSWIAKIEQKVGAETSKWPPNSLVEWQNIVKRIEYIAQSGEPEIEALWRIAGALGYTLWVPIPQELEYLFAEQLRIIKLNENFIAKILKDLESNIREERILSIEIIRNLFRYESKDQPNRIDSNESFAQIANEVLILQPNFFGIGINLNSIVKRWLTIIKNKME